MVSIKEYSLYEHLINYSMAF
uniref:Uncharacterized protein n=1 Tax=Tetranychus urticae TaxID=32264 RepID=T1JUS9_TETUR